MATSNPHPSRRALLSGAAALALGMAALPGAGLAMATGPARALVQKLVAEIMTIINSGKPPPALYRDFEQIFIRYADVPIIARSLLGVPWRTATPAQRQAFTIALRGYLARKYGSRFRQIIGGRIAVTDARRVKSFVAVTSTAYFKGQKPFEVLWLVSDKSGHLRFFNIVIEGVNMLITERTEVGAMLDRRRGNIDLLIKDLRAAR